MYKNTRFTVPTNDKQFIHTCIYVHLCVHCGAECESVIHVLWHCSAHNSIRVVFLEKLQELLGDRYVNFNKLNSIKKTTYVLRSELWEYNFDHLRLVKEYVVGVWDARKQKLYGDDLCPSQLISVLG